MSNNHPTLWIFETFLNIATEYIPFANISTDRVHDFVPITWISILLNSLNVKLAQFGRHKSARDH